MGKLESALKNIMNVFQQHLMYITYPVLLGLTAALEEVFEVLTFSCPCDTSRSGWYGWCYILIPAMVFFVIGVLATCLSPRIFLKRGSAKSGEENEEKNSTKEAKGVKSRAVAIRHEAVKYCSCSKVIKTLLAPCAWIFITLIDGDYYSCAMSDDPCGLGLIKVDNETMVNLEAMTDDSSYVESADNRKLKGESQIIGWIFIGAAALVILLGIMISRCIQKEVSPHSYFTQVYSKSEDKCFIETTKEKAATLAKQNVHSFLEKEPICKKDWISISADPSEIQESSESERLAYSPLHKWVIDNPPPAEQSAD